MKKAMEKVLTMVIALVLVLSMTAALAEEIEVEAAPAEEIVEVIETVEETETEEVEEVEVIEETAEEIVEETVIEEATEEEIPEDAQLLTTVEDALNAERSVSIYVSYEGDTVSYGDEIELYAVLNGYEGTSYSLQWQVSSDNANWANISGANGSEYDVTVSEDNAANYYRVAVTIDGVEI